MTDRRPFCVCCLLMFGLALPAFSLPSSACGQTKPQQSPPAQTDAAQTKPAQTVSPQTDLRKSSPQRIQLIAQTLSDEHPLVIAHRGASGYLPEHTTEAAAFAHALGADYIEQDVVMSKDGVAVVLHDVTLDDVTNVADVFPDRQRDGHYFVFDFTLAELRRLNVTERSHNAGRFPGGQGRFLIRTLEEHLQLIAGLNASRGRKAGVYVEVKQPALQRTHGLDASRAVIDLLTRYGYTSPTDRAFVQCFDADEVLRIRTELKCQLKLIQLFGETPSHDTLVATAKVADGIGIPIAAVLPDVTNGEPRFTEVVRTAHDHTLLVHVWTLRNDRLPQWAPSTEELIGWLVRDGRVDGIFTDFPDTVLDWREQARHEGPLRGPFHLLKGGRDKP